MKIVLFEFRKNILRKTIIIPMVILLIVNVMVIYAQYRFQNDPFSSEVNRYHYLLENGRIIKNYMHNLTVK
ncbi:hypothetical protein [Anaerostipes hadrus]|uniref:hypothetical protein n=1 Tax=Anaerostipes hadrus TaxID=649756 RepID=UPI001FB916B3|nr:hypothetical protein [Anaerostipes hadrus]MCQ4781911.1 hypothetical protein [Anaerostipes hadrus]